MPKHDCFASPLELWPRHGAFMSTFGEKQFGPQCLERITPAEPIHHPYQVVKRFSISVGDRMIKIVQNLIAPVALGPDNWLEIFMDFIRDRGFPCLIPHLCV